MPDHARDLTEVQTAAAKGHVFVGEKIAVNDHRDRRHCLGRAAVRPPEDRPAFDRGEYKAAPGKVEVEGKKPLWRPKNSGPKKKKSPPRKKLIFEQKSQKIRRFGKTGR